MVVGSSLEFGSLLDVKCDTYLYYYLNYISVYFIFHYKDLQIIIGKMKIQK